MEKLWEVFNRSYSLYLHSSEPTSNELVKEYIEKFAENFPLPIKQKKLLEKIFFVLLNEKKEKIDHVRSFFPFLFSPSELDSVINVHDLIISELKSKEKNRYKFIIDRSIQENVVPAFFHKETFNEADEYIYTVVFSHLINQNPSLFIESDRQKVLEHYMLLFSHKRFHVPFELLTFADPDLLKVLERLMNELPKNLLLNLSFSIVHAFKIQSIVQLIQDINEYYTILRQLLVDFTIYNKEGAK